MTDFNHEMEYIEAAVSQLEDYLLSSEIYYPIGVRSTLQHKSHPQLTLGNLLLSLKQAAGYASTLTERVELEKQEDRLQEVHTRWQVAWGAKASSEFRSRLNLWRNYLDEYREQPETNYDRYPYEVNRRVILNLLTPDADKLEPADYDLLLVLDNYLKAVLVVGDFIWDSALESEFPPEPYWYLYGNLKAST